MTHPSFAEVATQLHTLGYRTGDRCYIRALVPKNTPSDAALRHGLAFEPHPGQIVPLPKDGYLTVGDTGLPFTEIKRCKESGKWIDKRAHIDGLAFLEKLNAKGYGIYLVVNIGGRENEDILRCPSLFYECDKISKEEQFDKIDDLTHEGYQPTLVVETRNSLHVYLRTFEEGVDGWRQLQQRLIQRQDSDRSIHNPNRLMRLAGFYHWQWNSEQRQLEPFRLQIRLVTEAIYRRGDFDSILPAHDSARWSTDTGAEGFVPRPATDPTDNPWDIRNFAHYLDDYRPDGRRRWGHTAKCPAHNGVANNSLHINRDTGATKCHGSGNCSGKEIYHAALELAVSRGYQVPARRMGHSYRAKPVGNSAIAGLVGWVKRQVSRMPWGLGAKLQQSDDFASSAREPQTYAAGDRVKTWQRLVAQGHRHVLDTSGTGTGKSYDAGGCCPETLGCKKLFYSSSEHRNPSTPTLIEGWTDCPSRHNGIFRDEHGRQRRKGAEGEGYIVAPNCGRTMTSGALRDKQIAGADETSLLCQTCAYLESCRKGVDFGYIRQRSEALAADKIRIHPLSLPRVFDADGNIDYDYSEAVLLHDEAGEIFKPLRAFQVSVLDLQRTIADLLAVAPEQFEQVRPMLATLLTYLNGSVPQATKYGWNHRESVLALREKVLNVHVDSVRRALEIDLRPLLSTTDKYGVDIADLPRNMRGKFSDSDRTSAEKIRAEVALNWLPDVLEILTGSIAGALQIANGHLTVTVADYRYREVVQHAKANIYLDATMTVEQLAQRVGCDIDEIAHIQQYQQLVENVEMTQVTGLGRLGISGRSDFLQRRVDAVVDELIGTLPGLTAVIDFKRYTQNGENRWQWFRDSRGINDLQDVVNLILVGTPCSNLAAIEAEYICITGRVPEPGKATKTFSVAIPGKEDDPLEAQFTMAISSDPDFGHYCHQKIVATIIQAIGRLRADRRLGEKLQVYFLGDYPLPMPVKLKRAVDITPEAADKVQRLVKAIEDAKVWLKEQGQKDTCRAIAAIVGCTHARVVQLLKLVNSAIDNSNSKIYPPNDSQNSGSDAHMLGTVYLPLLAKEDPVDQVVGLLNAFVAHGSQIVSHAWSFLSAAASIQLQVGLLLALPDAEFKQLSAIA